jgi:hypothetical protein
MTPTDGAVTQEQEDWAALEKWRSGKTLRRRLELVSVDHWVVSLEEHLAPVFQQTAKSRAEAIHAAAEWCRQATEKSP